MITQVEGLAAARDEIARRARQQSALAELGQAALTRADVGLLVGQTCAVVEWALGASFVSVVEADGKRLTLRFGVGANHTFASCNDEATEHRPLLLCTLVNGQPAVFRTVIADARIDRDHLRDVHGVASGICIPIPGGERPFGLLTVYDDRDRLFATDEIDFLKAVADLSGAVILNAEMDQARRRAEERFRALVENAAEGIALIDSCGQVLYTGPSTERVLGYHDGLTGENLLAFTHPDDVEQARRSLRTLLDAEGTETSSALRLRHANGEWRWVEATCKNLLANRSVNAIVINYRDVTARKRAEETLQHLAYRDTLTDLPNRFLFQDRLQHAIEQARRRETGVAVMYVDLDRFKVVNDTLGHTIGDRLLQVVSQRLRDVLRADDTIARLGGDEFAVIIPEMKRAEEAGHVGRKLIGALREPIMIDGHELHATASAGISVFPSDGTDVETLLKHADAALYRSKDLGRNTVQLFASTMNRRYTERLELEMSLHLALDRDELTLVYQPVFDRESRTTRGFEALVRWNRPGFGCVSPAEFIHVAEESRLILPMGDWILRTACAQLREWRDAGLDDFHMAVNLSPHQLSQPHFIHFVHDTLQQYGLRPPDLELEVTEGSALQNLEWTLSVLDQLRTLGVRLAVDDFGTGQSSLVYLKRLPVTTLKIDREFLRDVQDASDAAIFASIVQLGHSLGLYVIAEGIETEEDRRLVEEQRCDGMQGYYFGRPMAGSEVPAWLHQFRYPAAVA